MKPRKPRKSGFMNDSRVAKFYSGKRNKILHRKPDYIENYQTYSFVAHAAAKSVWREFKESSYAEFKRLVFERIKPLHELVLDYKKYRLRDSHTSNRQPVTAPLFVTNFFEFPRKHMTFDQQVKALRMNLRFAGHWTRQGERKVGSFSVRPWLNWHPEAPLSYLLSDHYGVIASIGGYVYKKAGKTVIRITNIQGMRGKQLALKRFKGEHGENWRVFLLKRAAEYARKKGAGLEGELPQRYGGTSREEFKRQQKQYIQTFKKAGLETGRQDKLIWRLP